eukprot:Sdes_comp18382_c0_seq4m8195
MYRRHITEPSPHHYHILLSCKNIWNTTHGKLRVLQTLTAFFSMVACLQVHLLSSTTYWLLRFHTLVSLLAAVYSGYIVYCTIYNISCSVTHHEPLLEDILSSSLTALLLFLSSSGAASKGTALDPSRDASALSFCVLCGFLCVVFWITTAYLAYVRWKTGARRLSVLTEELTASPFEPYEPYAPPAGDL